IFKSRISNLTVRHPDRYETDSRSEIENLPLQSVFLGELKARQPLLVGRGQRAHSKLDSQLAAYWHNGSRRTLIVGKPLNARSALSCVKLDHSDGNLSSAKIASTGHSGTQASQSMQVSG